MNNIEFFDICTKFFEQINPYLYDEETSDSTNSDTQVISREIKTNT
jgi:hypothetical protein